MSQTRIYLPLSLAALDVLADDGAVAPAPVRAYAVTPELVSSLAHADEEEREYVALRDAAAAAAGLRARPGDRRIVAAADVDSGWVSPSPATAHRRAGQADRALSRVDVAEAVPLRRIVSFLVDENGGGADEDLLWYDVTELDEMRRFSRS